MLNTIKEMIGQRLVMGNNYGRTKERIEYLAHCSVLLQRLKAKGKVRMASMENEDKMIKVDSKDYKEYLENRKSDVIGAIDPTHYTQTSIEPIKVIEAWKLGFHLGSAVKYIARNAFSGTRKKDLIKAANYCYRAATGKWLPKELIKDE